MFLNVSPTFLIIGLLLYLLILQNCIKDLIDRNKRFLPSTIVNQNFSGRWRNIEALIKSWERETNMQVNNEKRFSFSNKGGGPNLAHQVCNSGDYM